MWSPLALAYPLGLGLSGFRGEEDRAVWANSPRAPAPSGGRPQLRSARLLLSRLT